MLTAANIRQIIVNLRENRIRPCVVTDKAEAARLNNREREIGSSHRWKVGEEYYIYYRGGNGRWKPLQAIK